MEDFQRILFFQYADIELVNKKGDMGCFLEWYDTDKFYKFKDIGCRNDHATKAYLKGATKGTWITIYEDSDGRRDRSYTTIKVFNEDFTENLYLYLGKG